MKPLHIHQLRKHRPKDKSKTPMYFCTLNCNFKIEEQYALGKEVLCYICGDPFVMTEASLKLDKPHCADCGRKAVVVNGKKTYVNRRKGKTLSLAASEVTDSLRERLANVVNYDPSGDI